MRKLVVNTFMSLDGVMQSPGGPDEDPTGGFTHGGWAVNYFDDEMMEQMSESGPYELLLGRGTYEIFAAHWPHDEGPIADHLNSTRKHVASTTLEQLDWNNSTLITGDVADYVAALKTEDGPEIQVHGSPGLIQTLLQHDLIDEYRMWIFPVVIGTGKRFFGDGAIPAGTEAGRQQGHEDRRHGQHLRTSGRHRSRIVRVRRADRGRDRTSQGPLVARALVAPAHGLLVAHGSPRRARRCGCGSTPRRGRRTRARRRRRPCGPLRRSPRRRASTRSVRAPPTRP